MKKSKHYSAAEIKRPIDYLTEEYKTALLMIRQFKSYEDQGKRMTYEEYLHIERLLNFQKRIKEEDEESE